MGGRGASAGLIGGGGGGGGLGAMFGNAPQQPQQPPQNQQQPGNVPNSLQGLVNELLNNPVTTQTSAVRGDYDGNGNPELMKWQNQIDEDKMARYLAKIGKDHTITNLQTNEPWGFYDNPLQKMVLSMKLNDKPTILSKKDFDALAARTGAEVINRGWETEESLKCYMQSDYNHLGTGRYGDGRYFGSASTAASYGSNNMKAMLSPKARVIDVRTLIAMMPNNGGNLQKALYTAGHEGPRQYVNDVGGEAQWALKLGYNVIDAGWCKCVLTRDALIIREH